ncbi:hypothetical protein D9M69_595430 [compost metagenome]
MPTLCAAKAILWKSVVEVLEICARLEIWVAVSAVLLTHNTVAPAASAAAAPIALPAAAACLLISFMRFSEIREAWSMGPVKPPILAIRSRVSCPSDLLAMALSVA